MHKISFWKSLTLWRPVLPLHPRAQMPPVCSPPWAPFRGCWKVSGCSTWFNPYRGRWQGPFLLFSCSLESDSLRPHGLQHARPLCPSPTPWACSNSCPSSRWCHPTVSSSVVPFSSCGWLSFLGILRFLIPGSLWGTWPKPLCCSRHCQSQILLATWCGELTHWKRPWCWERWKAGGEGGDRGWDGWMASPTRWTWLWANSGRWWWTGKPGVLQSMESQRVGHNWATEQLSKVIFFKEKDNLSLLKADFISAAVDSMSFSSKD